MTDTGMQSLYPFLYAGENSSVDLAEEVRRSTAEKAVEIVELRNRLAAEIGPSLAACASAMAERFSVGGRLYCFGNGGSSTDAQAVAQLFSSATTGRRALPAVALPNDVAVLTALANDVGFEVVFARQLGAFATPQDIAFGLSTSGGSANVLRAFDEAKRRGMLTIGLAGYDGGSMRSAGLDHLFVVPSSSVHRIQEAQTTLYDILWELVQVALEHDAEGQPR